MNSPQPLTICLPIVLDSTEKVIDAISGAPDDYTMIEVWLDYITDLSERNLDRVLKAIGSRTPLLLFRRSNLEPIQIPFEQRTSYLASLPNSVWIDLDVSQQSDEIEWCRAHRKDLPLVLSYHNYQFTPAIEKLRELAIRMKTYGATVAKFSTFCQEEADALRLMSLLLEIRATGQRAAVLGMGAAGVLTRVVGHLLGSSIAYAPVDVANSSAPGQLTLRQLQTILRELQPS